MERGNTYLHTLVIHGARAALPSLSASQTAMGEWLLGLVGRAHKNKVVVALACKLARIGAKLPPCTMVMKACCSAHHLGRVLREQGHEVRLMSPEYVQPYVKAQKNDERDAEAIAETAIP